MKVSEVGAKKPARQLRGICPGQNRQILEGSKLRRYRNRGCVHAADTQSTRKIDSNNFQHNRSNNKVDRRNKDFENSKNCGTCKNSETQGEIPLAKSKIGENVRFRKFWSFRRTVVFEIAKIYQNVTLTNFAIVISAKYIKGLS